MGMSPLNAVGPSLTASLERVSAAASASSSLGSVTEVFANAKIGRLGIKIENELRKYYNSTV